MKLKHVIFTIVLAIIILLVGNCNVFGGHIYTRDNITNRDSNFAYTWDKTTNAFCLDAFEETPTKAPTDEDIEEIENNYYLYIMSQINLSSSRNYNWQQSEQYAIWEFSSNMDISTLLGDRSGIYRYYYAMNCDRIRGLIAGAKAYNAFASNYKKPEVQAESVESIGGRIGPFALKYNQTTMEVSFTEFDYPTSTYGNNYYPWDGTKPEETVNASYGGLTEIILNGIKINDTQYEIEDNNLYLKNVDSIIKDSNVIQFSFESIISGEIYKVTPSVDGEQDYIFGSAEKATDTIEVQFDLSGLEITLKKTDMEGNELSGAVFGYAAYTDDTDGLSQLLSATYMVDGETSNVDNSLNIGTGWRKAQSSNKIKIANINDCNNVYIIFKEETPPPGYKKLKYNVAVKFQKENGGKWTYVGIGKGVWNNTLGQFEFINDDVSNLVQFSNNTLTIKNEPEENTINFELQKRDSETGILLPGAEFAIYAFQDESLTTQIFEANVQTDSDGKAHISINVENEGINKVWVKIKETKAPQGYIISESEKTLTFIKGEDGIWTCNDLNNNVVMINNAIDPENPPDPTDPSNPPDSPDFPSGAAPSKDIVKGYVYLDGFSGNKSITGYDGNKSASEPGIEGVIVYLKKRKFD